MDKGKLQFDFYAYNGPTDGTWREHGQDFFAGQDFRTVERLKEYKDAGMTIYMPQNACWYYGEDFETSDAKMMMDRALEAGIDRVILADSRIQTIPLVDGGIIGEDKQFKTEQELDDTIKAWMSQYKDHPAFYGVQLKDEPLWNNLKAYGQIYRSVKRVNPQAFVQTCLCPMIKSTNTRICIWMPPLTAEEKQGLSEDQIRVKMFKKYIEMYLDETGADYFMYDQYPLIENNIYEVYVQAVQAAAEVSRDRKVKFYNVTQTMCMGQNLQGDDPKMQRVMTENDAYFLNNMLVGFGVKQTVFYTYFPYKENSVAAWFYEEGSFLNRHGEKNELYYFMQKIMREEQKLAPTILNYNYSGCKVFAGERKYQNNHADLVLGNDTLSCIKTVSVDKEVALVTELKNSQNECMYMLQNIADPLNDVSQTITVQFDSQFVSAILFEKGEERKVTLDNGKLTLTHNAGHATYVVPCK